MGRVEEEKMHPRDTWAVEWVKRRIGERGNI